MDGWLREEAATKAEPHQKSGEIVLDSAITQLAGYLTQPLMYTMQIAGDGQTCIPLPYL